jgi:hypothetical protein
MCFGFLRVKRLSIRVQTLIVFRRVLFEEKFGDKVAAQTRKNRTGLPTSTALRTVAAPGC